MKAFLALLITVLAVLPAYADDWKTSDGKIYQNVKVLKVEDDAVTILFSQGGARVALSLLPADLQKKFGYDPDKAKAAAQARAAAEAENAKKLAAEKALADKLKKDQQIKEAQAQQKAAVAAGANNQ